MRLAPPQPPKRLITLTPLIDVVFILLVFFMLASSYLDWHAIDLNISSGKGAASSSQRAILISLGADGSLAVGSQTIGQGQLATLVGARLADNPDQRVVVRSEPGVPLQRAVNILDLLRGSGAADVSLSRTR